MAGGRFLWVQLFTSWDQRHLPTAHGLLTTAPPARLLSSALHLFQALLNTMARGFPVKLSIWAGHRVLGKLPRPPVTCGTKPKSLVSPARHSSPAPALTESLLFCRHLLPASQTCPSHSPNAATLFPPRGYFCVSCLLSPSSPNTLALCQFSGARRTCLPQGLCSDCSFCMEECFQASRVNLRFFGPGRSMLVASRCLEEWGPENVTGLSPPISLASFGCQLVNNPLI